MQYGIFDEKTKKIIVSENPPDREHGLKEVAFIGGHCVSTINLWIEHGGGAWFESYVFEAEDGEITNWSEVCGLRARTYDEVMGYHNLFVGMLERGIVPTYSNIDGLLAGAK